MSLRCSAMAALASSAWLAILSLAAVPVYLSRLGIEAFGVIGFFVTTQAILQVLDLGLAPAVNRQLARLTTLGQLDTARNLLRTLACIYWAMAGVIAALFYFGAEPIATAWLGSSQLPRPELIEALTLMGFVIAARWPIAIYQNALIGLGRLGALSAANAAMTTLTIAASIGCVLYVSPTLRWLFLTQAGGTLMYALVVRHLAWRAIGTSEHAKLTLSAIKSIWAFSAAMAGVTLTGIALTQLDKTLLSRMLPLASFGEYMLAATAVGGLGVVITPLFSVIYPRFSVLVASDQGEALQRLYRDGSRVFAIVFLPLVIALALYAFDIIWLWTGDLELAGRVAPLVRLLCVGSAINGLMYFPYSVQLAYGLSWIPLAINSMLLIVLAPLIFVLTAHYGARGGAAAWAVLEMLYLALGTYLTHRHVALGSGARWAWNSVALPFLTCTSLMLAMQPLISYAPGGSVLKVAAVGLSVLVTPLVSALGFPSLRAALFARLKTQTASLNLA